MEFRRGERKRRIGIRAQLEIFEYEATIKKQTKLFVIPLAVASIVVVWSWLLERFTFFTRERFIISTRRISFFRWWAFIRSKSAEEALNRGGSRNFFTYVEFYSDIPLRGRGWGVGGGRCKISVLTFIVFTWSLCDQYIYININIKWSVYCQYG